MDGKNLFLALMCINLVLYVAGFQLVENDLLSRFMDKEELADGNFNINADIESKIPDNPGSGGIISGIAGGFLDVISIFWDFVKLFFNLVTAPVALFSLGMHPTISILIGVPYVLMILLAVIQFARGANL